jgi:hypothetical protein
VDEVEKNSDEIEENFTPVRARVRPHASVSVKSADTYVAGYKVEETLVGDDEHSITVNDLKTTGIDPYNSGDNFPSNAKKADSEK